MTDVSTRRISISLPSTGDEEWQALREPLFSGWLTQGPKVAAFEKAFAERHRVAHALAVTSCTTGLHLMLAAAGMFCTMIAGLPGMCLPRWRAITRAI